jgi:Ca2+-dependent lipid-binding protein
MPDGPAPTIPDWYKVGWRSVGGIDNELPEGEAKELSLLETFVDEQYYGDWYHNAALVFFVSLFSQHTSFHPTNRLCRPYSHHIS